MDILNQKEKSDKIAKCLEAINIEIKELNLQHKSADYNNKMLNIVINGQCEKFKLRPKNIKAIYFGKFRT